MTNSLKNLTIGDLIELPIVRTVIDMSEVRDLDPDDPEGRVALESLSQSFIVTEDILEILSIILRTINTGQGRGFFIIGTYGSGKSHLLSILGLVARYKWARSSILSQDPELVSLKQSVEHRRLLPVLIPLTEFSGEISLEKIVWHTAEMTAAVAGIPLNLSHSQRYIDLFNKYILPVHDKEFHQFIKKRFDTVTWDQICRDDPASGHTIILQFINRTKQKIPFDIIVDRKELLESLIRSLKENGWDGILFIIDELSEFLKSKPTPQLLNEDARFLQFLGESSKSQPLWIVAALQEALERTGDIPVSVFNKIKDRYHQRLRLTTKHLHELVSKRLIKRKGPESLKIIKTIFSDLKKAFNKIPISDSKFISIYPIHPETLELLNQNIDLFSQRRGVVDFLSARIQGRKESKIPGILDQPCYYLLTPDVIFDHFIDRLAESPQFSPYYLFYQQQIIDKIANYFSSSDELTAALRTIKILIILAISPLKEKRTVRELANMILFRVMDPSILAGDANYAFFEERIIQPLYKNTGILVKEPGATKLDDIYELQILSSDQESLDDRIARIKSSLELNAREINRKIIQTMGHGQFPLAVFDNRNSYRESVLWQYTRRRVVVRLLDFSTLASDDIQEIRSELKAGKTDLALLMAYPGKMGEQQLSAQTFLSCEPAATLHSWLFLIPSINESSELRNAYLEIEACTILSKELSEVSSDQKQLDLSANLRERKQTHLDAAQSLFRSGYRNCVFFQAEGRIPVQNSKLFDNFDRWLESIIDIPLKRRFPDHQNVAPSSDCTSRVIQDLLLTKLIKPGKTGKLKLAKDEALKTAIEFILLPLGLAVKKGDSFILSASPGHSPAARIIMERLPVSETINITNQDTTVSAGRVWLALCNSTFGISRPVFDLTLAALIRKGYVSAFCSTQKVDIENLQIPLTGQIDRLSRGELLSENLRPAFKLLYRMLMKRPLQELDIDSQSKLWKKLLDQMDTWNEITQQFHENLEIINSRFIESGLNIPEIKKCLKILTRLSNAIIDKETVTPDWNNFLPVYVDIDEPDKLNSVLKKLKRFNEIGLTPYLVSCSYLQDTRLAIPSESQYDPLRSLYQHALDTSHFNDDLVLGNGLKVFLDQFKRFHQVYINSYLDGHSARNQWIDDQKFNLIVSSPEAVLLEKLQSIPVIRRTCPARKAVFAAISAEKHKCNADPTINLATSPICRCGFKLGDPPDLPDSITLRKQIIDQIQISLEIIQSKEISGMFLKKLPADKSFDNSQAEALLRLDSKDINLAEKINSLLDRPILSALNSIDSIRPHQSVIHLTRLSNLLAGQTLTMDQARRKVHEWLESNPNLKDDDWIYFKD